uniref:DUF4283 domain-containing protein n=1 Tax=Tanacetum cinerariifolium TaxID=118510 RepID=A0A6L2NRV1_TANCI|nr:hypothetical protein [Tanacetum cinerariifolium]
MEAGFLLGNKASKTSGLVAKVNNIERKLLGKDGQPWKSCLKTASSKTTKVNSGGAVVHIEWLGLGVQGANKRGDVDGINNDQRLKQAHPKKVHVSVMTNEEKVLGTNVAIPIDVVDEISDKFVNTLHGFFVGERLVYPIVENYVKNAWAKYGFERAIYRNGFFFFKFSSHEGMAKTLDAGPWFIRSMPIVVYEWSANTKLKNEEIKKVLVWVKIHNVPMVVFSKTRLSLITTQLGFCELSSECDVLETIVVAIPLPKGKGHYLETLDVEYEWSPPHCSKCKNFDHEKKGVNKAATKQDFRFTEPTNLIYRPVSKPSTNNVKSKPNSNASHVSKEDDVDLGQIQSNIEKLMDDEKVLELNTNLILEGGGDTVNSTPSTHEVSTNPKSVPVEAKGNETGSLWEQFRKSHETSSIKLNSFSDSEESEVEEVCIPEISPGGGFLDDMEDDLDCFDGYEDQVYDLKEQEQEFCDRFDIRLNSRCRK